MTTYVIDQNGRRFELLSSEKCPKIAHQNTIGLFLDTKIWIHSVLELPKYTDLKDSTIRHEIAHADDPRMLKFIWKYGPLAIFVLQFVCMLSVGYLLGNVIPRSEMPLLVVSAAFVAILSSLIVNIAVSSVFSWERYHALAKVEERSQNIKYRIVEE